MKSSSFDEKQQQQPITSLLGQSEDGSLLIFMNTQTSPRVKVPPGGHLNNQRKYVGWCWNETSESRSSLSVVYEQQFGNPLPLSSLPPSLHSLSLPLSPLFLSSPRSFSLSLRPSPRVLELRVQLTVDLWWNVRIRSCLSSAGLWFLGVWSTCRNKWGISPPSTAVTARQKDLLFRPNWPGSCRRSPPSLCRWYCCCKAQRPGPGRVYPYLPSCCTISTGE